MEWLAIVYENPEGPTKDPTTHRAYVAVDFPECTIAADDALWRESKADTGSNSRHGAAVRRKVLQ